MKTFKKWLNENKEIINIICFLINLIVPLLLK